MTEPQFTIDTKMEPNDHKKFLFIATLRGSALLPIWVLVVSAAGAYLLSIRHDDFSLVGFLLRWLFLLAVAVSAVSFLLVHKNKQRIRTDKTGIFGSTTTLLFYENRLEINTASMQSTASLEYNKFHRLLESKEYFIFYFNQNQATLLRKQDVPDIDALRLFLKEKFPGNYKTTGWG